LQVAKAPPGAQAAQIDLESAYRQMAILPAHKPYLAIRTAKGVYVDHCNPFGLSSAAGVLGEAVDAAVDVIRHAVGVALFKWVDDIICGRTPIEGLATLSYSHGLKDITDILEFLGFKIAYAKVKDFADSCTYNGFWWDIKSKRVGLPDKKRAKYLVRVSTALAPCARLSLKDAQTLQGCLVHICFVFLEGRARLPSLHRFVSSFDRNNRFSRRFPSPMMLSDLQWWAAALSHTSFSRSLWVRPLIDLDIWVDASTSWGVALVVGAEFQAWQLRPGWDVEGCHIGWAECIGIEIAMLFAVQSGVQDSRVLVHSDNSGAVGQFLKGRSRNTQINASIIRAEECSRSVNISVEPVYVKSEENRADGASRGMPQPELSPLPHLIALGAAIRSFFVDE
jgi:hypothetical protein